MGCRGEKAAAEAPGDRHEQEGDERRCCKDAERYVARQSGGAPKKAVIACEGACIKGEVARTAANLLASRLERDAAARICLGDAVTADSGMLELVRRAPEVIAIEGCSLRCGSRLLARRAPELHPTVIEAQRLYTYDRERYFEILDMPREALDELAGEVAARVREQCFKG
jgi:uncharacterized metal-binding protein